MRSNLSLFVGALNYLAVKTNLSIKADRIGSDDAVFVLDSGQTDRQTDKVAVDATVHRTTPRLHCRGQEFLRGETIGVSDGDVVEDK